LITFLSLLFSYLQLEDIGIVETLEDGGRSITDEGRKDLDTISNTVAAADEE
jgi:ribosomal protein S19E (S16A)